MARNYAKDQPAGFTNRIEKVAIVGVSQKKLVGNFKLAERSRLLGESVDILLRPSSRPVNTL